MGINSYSQNISVLRTQGDLSKDKLPLLPILQQAFNVSRERHTTEVKRASYDEQPTSNPITSSNDSATTMNWEVEANYICPPVVHLTPATGYMHLADCVIQTCPPTGVIPNNPNVKATILNEDFKQLVDDEIRQQQDDVPSATAQHQHTIIGNSKQNFANFGSTDLSGSKVIRLVRAKQAGKRKSSLDTLIEVVQKELQKVNGQSSSSSNNAVSSSNQRTSITSKHNHHSSYSKSDHSTSHHNLSSPSFKRPSSSSPSANLLSSVLPASHPSSITAQSNRFKTARKIVRRPASMFSRKKSFEDNDDYNDNEMTNYDNLENIEDIVQETVDALVAMATMNTAPFVVNMLTAIPSQQQQQLQSISANLSAEQKSFTTGAVPPTTITNFPSHTKSIPVPSLPSNSTAPNYYRNDLALLSSTASDIRNSMQLSQQQHQQIQTAIPISAQPISSTFLTPTLQHINLHHSTATSSSTIASTSSSVNSSSQIFFSDTPKTVSQQQQSALFVTPNLPRILNIQTVVPKPTTNLQLGATKIILVSPTNHHPQNHQHNNQHQQSPVKLVKFSSCPPSSLQTARTIASPVQITATNEFNQQHQQQLFQRRSATTATGSTITLPANVQIVMPTQSQSSNLQFTRTSSDSISSNNNKNNCIFRSSTPTTCDHLSMIPQAAQEITVTTSPTPAYSLSMSPLRSTDLVDTSLSTNTLLSPTNNQQHQQQYYFSQNDGSSPFNGNHSVIITNNGNSKPRRRSSSSAPFDKPIGKVLRPVAKVLQPYPNATTNIVQPMSAVVSTSTSPMHHEATSMTSPQQRQTATAGPMIYRMTSMNPNVPVFRVSTAAKATDLHSKPTPTTTTVCYENKHNNAGGAVSVLACFKTTKKRNKERAIMPRPSADSDSSNDHRLINSSSLVSNPNGLISHGNTNVMFQMAQTDGLNRQLHQNRSIIRTSSNSTMSCSEESVSNNVSLLANIQESKPVGGVINNRINTIEHRTHIQLNNNPSSVTTITTPLTVSSPFHSSFSSVSGVSTRPLMEDKCIQSNPFDEEPEEEDQDDEDGSQNEKNGNNEQQNENSMEYDGSPVPQQEIVLYSQQHHEASSSADRTTNKRIRQRDNEASARDESWTVAADSLLRNVLSQYGFRFLDLKCQQNLSTKFDTIQANLVSGTIASKDDFFYSVMDIKRKLLENDLSKIAADNLEKLFNYFETQYPKLKQHSTYSMTSRVS
ncbi:unnamed protein product [Didymodactylos carnosus]|uniref:ENT domain-containing protein n=1 Tax=Didymodactylos carnosus TaxID=1234261 RepID=A0A813NQH0_9BILA|nr:unnamed protein product [Didymodactylos carnosus]CAF0754063.1 unnamed protein product [Didymodactylos carnosus]CAF3519381.1 unnamed protein product [Didymodactylos carnosus]CAF3533098.1 unnamed protein product [Didymodactylos carnosus]